MQLANQCTFSYELIHASMPRQLAVNGACGRVLCPAAHAFSAGIKCRHCTFLVPKKLTFSPVLTKQSGVVPGMVDRGTT